MWAACSCAERLVETCDSSKYQFINPDLVCNDKPVVSKQGYATLRIKLDDFIAEATKEKKLDSISIYLRDLEDGPTMGIDEHEKFSPASLLKLPMLITYLNLEEDQPSLATTELFFQEFRPRHGTVLFSETDHRCGHAVHRR